MTRERIAALDRLGMVWDVDKFLWEQKYELARRYFQKHGNLQVPIQYTTPDGTRLLELGLKGVCCGSAVGNA